MRNEILKIFVVFVLLAVAMADAEPLIISLNGGELAPNVDYQPDLPQYGAGCSTMENAIPLTQGAAMRRPGTEMIEPANGAKIPVHLERDITWQFVNGNGMLWGMPFTDEMEILHLDAKEIYVFETSATYGEDIIGIPCYLHPFVAGQEIMIIANSGTNAYAYPNTYIVQPESNELYIAIKVEWGGTETAYTGDEIVALHRTLFGGAGRMVMTDDGTMYAATHISTGYCGVTKISYDMKTVDNEFFTFSGTVGTATTGLALSDDQKHLYVWGDNERLFKMDLEDGSEVWRTDGADNWAYYYYADCATAYLKSRPSPAQSYNITVDADDNVYVMESSSKHTLSLLCPGVGSGYSDPVVSRISPVYTLTTEDPPMPEMTFGDDVTLTGLTSGATCTVKEVIPLIPLTEIAKEFIVSRPTADFIPGEIVTDWTNYAIVESLVETPEFEDWYPACTPPYGRGVYDSVVDDASGLIFGGTATTAFYNPTYELCYPKVNLWAYDTDGSVHATAFYGREPQVVTGDFYSMDDLQTREILLLDGSVYVLSNDESPDKIYKFNTSLEVVDSVSTGDDNGVGILADAFGHIVLCRTDGLAANGIDDCLWFYDTDLDLLGTVSGAPLLSIFGIGVGGSWIKGDWCFKSPVRTSHSEYTYYVDNPYPLTQNIDVKTRLFGFEYSTDEAFVIGISDQTIAIYNQELSWSDDFESNDFTSGGWITSGDVAVCSSDGWLSAYPPGGNYYASIPAGGWIEKRISTGGQDEVHLTYGRSRNAGTTSLLVEWSIDGTSWTPLETVTGTAYRFYTKAVKLPSTALNNRGFRVRFRAVSETLYVDDVFLTETPLYSQVVSAPDPTDGETEAALSIYLEWTPSFYSASQKLYFGSTNPPSYVADMTSTNATYYLESLTYKTPYYWRVDTIAPDGATYTGTVWSFTTQDSPFGTYWAKAGDVERYGVSAISKTIDCPDGDLTFTFVTATDSSSNRLRFYVDGGLEDYWYFDEPATEATYSVAAGSHTFKWEYYRGSYSDDDGAVWVDNITFPDGSTEDFEDGNLTGWTLSGDVNWTVEATE